MEVEPRSSESKRRFNEVSTRISTATDRATSTVHEIDAKTRNAAHDMNDLKQEYFEAIDFNAIDLLKVPSAITLLGIALTALAAKDLNSAKGLVLLALGFICDNADGLAAKIFDQESDAGALFDVIADKLKILITLLAAWTQDAVPKPALTAIGVIESSHVALTAVTKWRHKTASIRPPKTAKIAMASRNAAVGAHLISNYLLEKNPDSKTGKYIRYAKIGLTALSIGLEIPTLRTYINRTRIDGIVDDEIQPSS